MTTEKQDPLIGKNIRLTGPGWPSHMKGRIVTIKRVESDGSMVFWSDSSHWYATSGGPHAAIPVDDDPPSPPADTRKRLREYTDLGDNDVVVIAGAAVDVRREHGVLCLRADNVNYPFTDMPFADMLVDEVRRAKHKVMERVYREVSDREKCIENGMLYVQKDDIVITSDKTWVVTSGVGGARLTDKVFRLVDEREVEE